MCAKIHQKKGKLLLLLVVCFFMVSCKGSQAVCPDPKSASPVDKKGRAANNVRMDKNGVVKKKQPKKLNMR